MNPELLAIHPLLRQAGEHSVRPAQPSGHAALDAVLHEGGWPLGALTELLTPLPGLGEMPLLAPALATLLERPGWLVLVTPPGLPHTGGWVAAGLPPGRLLILRPDNPRDWLWSVDQAARAGMPAVLAWPGKVRLNGKSLRRLQLAAEEGGGLLVLSRRPGSASESSPAALRLRVQAFDPGSAGAAREMAGLNIDVLKQRGGWGGQQVRVSLPYPAAAPPPRSAWGQEQVTVRRPVVAPVLSLVG